MPKREWAEYVGNLLRPGNFRHFGGEVISEKIEGSYATVVLDADISTVAGLQKQKELYRLRKVGGMWLIDEVEVLGEY